MKNFILYNDLLKIKPFQKNFITQDFIKFLNDKKVNKFLSTRKKKQNIDTAKSYYQKMKIEKNLYHGIFDKKTDKIIGTLTLRKKNNKNSFLGIMIGDRKYLGTKFPGLALNIYIDHAFRLLGFKSVEAGSHKPNLSSAFFFSIMGSNSKKKKIYFIIKYN